MNPARSRLMEKLITLLLLLAFQWPMGRPASAEEPATILASSEDAALLLYYGEEELITTATKQPTPINKVPAVATVITEHQIRDMGARTLLEALKIVPGMGVYQDFSFDKSVEIRGVKTLSSQKVLVLLDGNRMDNPTNGGAILLYGDFPLDDVRKIEIVRGPVSALYGADAFLGVVNIITKSGQDIGGLEMRAGGGGFGAQRYNILAGRKSGDLNVSAQINYLESGGFRGKVDRDTDPFVSSIAPGKTDYWRQRFDLSLKASWQDIQFEYRHSSKHLGPYVGFASALNDESHLRGMGDIAEIRYRKNLTEKLDLTARIYGRAFKADFFWELYSEGYAGAFADGMLGNPRVRMRTYGFEMQADYKLSSNQLLTAGVNLERTRQYDVENWGNFDPVTYLPLPGGFQNISSGRNWNQSIHRNIGAWYLQDSWNITSKLNVIAGVRHDQYSDFGNTTNPRIGIAWEFMDNTYLKVLAGRAFRAPTFEELYNINNPSLLGNPDLMPERITTTEISVESRVLSKWTLKMGYFKNYCSRTIQLLPISGGANQYRNTGRTRHAGIEAEARYDFNRTDHAYANFTWLEPKRLGGGGEIADIPKWRSSVGGNVAFARWFNFNTNIFVSGDRPRAAGDWRKDIPSYAVLDAALTMKNFWKGLELQLLAKNLLDKRYDDPAPVTTVSGDYPRDGREISLEARYTF